MSNTSDMDRIAITGMACRFAGSEDLGAFWRRILDGVPALSDPPDGEAFRFHMPDSKVFNRVTTLRGGYLRELWQTLPASVGLTAPALAGTNPEHALFMDLAAQAFRDAGYAEKSPPRERTAVILGYNPHMDPAAVNWMQQGLVIDQTLDLVRRCFPHGSTQDFESLRQNLLRCLPEYDSRNTPGLFNSAILARLAQKLDLRGPGYLVSAACASSLLALQAAMDELRTGRADVALAGGLAGVLTPQLMMPFSHLGLLSRHDVPHPFGRDADGTLFGEGGGLLVLKRLDDARRDGDRIYALLRGIGISMDGNGQNREDSQMHALQRALAQSSVTPNSIAMIEAHGSGISAQDRSEVRALAPLLGGSRTRPAVALGSVKALIGHCGAAAGAASVIKAALALYHRIIPPSQDAQFPHPQLKLNESPFYLNLNPRPWVHNDAGQPRRAGVNVVAMSGLAAHALLEQMPGEL